MVCSRIYRGKLISHSLWKCKASDVGLIPSGTELLTIEMSPGLAGTYAFKIKVKNRTKNYIYLFQFNKVKINDNIVSFFVSTAVNVNDNSVNTGNLPILVIEFEEGEVARLLSEDRWFKNESWFKVEIEDLQLTIF